jgi:3-hydroxyisobutyrate dehydrogenase
MTRMTTKPRTKIGFLGLGAMGARMAARLVNDDTELKVWSRSGLPQGFPSLSHHLVPTAAAAVADAEIVIAMVTDDEASRAVWLDSGALRDMRPGSLAVECSTLTPEWVGKLARQAQGEGVTFVDAPVIGSRPQADAGSLIFLAGGEASSLERLRPTLLRMGSAIHLLGASPAGAHAKLLANALFAAQVATLAEIVTLARRVQLDLPALARAFDGLPVMSLSAKSALTGMLAGAFAPLFPLRLAAKDLRYAVAEARAAGSDVPMTQTASELFERGIGCELAEENLTAVVKLYAAER